ncbi:MAG: YesL family protein [Lachnospiraceae bacterium]|nr:YesL family protein [Lachnospiraceae bacterium]MBP3754657.1 YesL family protein [Lachnospiraceae bacterium]
MRFLNPESKIMVILTKVADLMWLNLVTLVMCIPVVTAGAALTAKDYMCYKILKNEEAGITKGFFHSFKQNFKQATLIWLMMMVVLGFVVVDILFALGLSGSGVNVVRAIIYGIAFFIYIACIMIFPVLARFDNTLFGTIKSGVHMTVAILPRAILMGVLYIVPIYVGLHWFAVVPIVIMFGISGPGYVSAMLYRKAFEQVESKFYEEHPELAPETDPVEEAMQEAMKRDTN